MKHLIKLFHKRSMTARITVLALHYASYPEIKITGSEKRTTLFVCWMSSLLLYGSKKLQQCKA
jgi:hypothetical protein